MRHVRFYASVAAVMSVSSFVACSSDNKSSDPTAATSTSAVASTTARSTATTTPATPSTNTATDPATDPTATGGAGSEPTTDHVPSSTTSNTSTAGSSTDSSTLAVDDRIDQASAALRAGDFSTMLKLLELSGLSDEINGRAVTILAPTEQAFSSLSGSQLTQILTNPTKIKDILQRHILDEVLTYEQLAASSSVTTLAGETLTVTSSGGVVRVDGATVDQPAVDALTGDKGQEIAVYGIDRVLVDGA